MTTACLEDFKIQKLPNSAYYIPEFISKEEEDTLLNKIYTAPKPKWKCLSNRRLQNWGGLPHPKGMIQEPLPEWLSTFTMKIANLGVFDDRTPNHVLVNEYLPGQGIMPHEDGPLFYPTITTINIGSHTVLDYYLKAEDSKSGENETNEVAPKNSERQHAGSILLERRSLLIVKNDLYYKYLHGIEERASDVTNDKIANISQCTVSLNESLKRDTRLSLTVRNVPNVLKAQVLFGKLK